MPLLLKNKAGNTNIVKNDGMLEKLGAELATVDQKTAAANEISGGVVVKRINEGLLRKSRMQEGFIITSINDQPLKNLPDLERAIAANKGRKIKIEIDENQQQSSLVVVLLFIFPPNFRMFLNCVFL